MVMGKLPSIGLPLVVLIGITMVVTWVLTISSWRQKLCIVVGFYLAVGTLASALYTRNLIGLSFTLTGNAPFTPARYMVLSGAVLVFMACVILEHSPLRDPRLQAVCLILIFSIGIRFNFRQPPYADIPWSKTAPKIVAWRAAHAAGKSDPLKLPIVPGEPFWINLP